MKPKQYTNALIVETENAIRQLEPKLQNVYCHLATRQIKRIITTNKNNIFHKRQQYNLNKIKKIIKNNKLRIIKADKTKALVIIDNEKLSTKINEFITENQMRPLNRDKPTHIKHK
jgi:hypothetical protein